MSDNAKINFIVHHHSNSSQKCIGTYPEGTTRGDIEQRVRRKFGDCFEQFGNGTFIAYTD